MARIGRIMTLATAVLCLTASTVQGRPAHKQAFGQYFGAFLSKKLNDCRACHLPDPAGKPQTEDDSEKPHNVFGARLKAIKSDLRKAGKSTTLEARLRIILDEDSDGDGVSNLIEILTGHFPGDKDDRPTAAELDKAKTVVTAFGKMKDGHPWRPFEVVQRPDVPAVKNSAWIRNPIDAFISAEHEALGLRPRPEAPREVLLRRVSLDLIGLPPTPEELRAFLQDTSADAYEKVVERLLSSPHYGERWGRHWMDVWRYSDWAGYGPQVRDSQPHIWRWRDWIVESLNLDKGYDRMLLEMLAGDELAPEDPKALTATGYLVRSFKLLSREKWLQDTVDHTAQAFLGVTLACAKCHDHMYDPILQKEYYQLRAIFEPHQVRTDRLPGQPDAAKDGLPRVYDGELAAPTYFFIRGDDRTPDKSKSMAPGVPEVLGGHFPKIDAVALPASAVHPERRSFVIRETIQASEAARAKARAALAALDKQGAPPESALALATLELALTDARHDALQGVLWAEELEATGQNGSLVWQAAARAAVQAQRQANLLDAKHKLLAAEQKPAPSKKGKKVEPEKAVLEAKQLLAKAESDLQKPLDTNYTRRATKTYPDHSSGRRLAFARWLADRDNPLTARVAVNHIWLRHFGQAIVPTVSDFGRNGRPPSHPALLDWLAAEFMAPTPASEGREPPEARSSPWSMKHVHRLIVTSSAYRMASTPDASNLGIDRDNKYLWRMAPRRLEAEAIRDGIFHVAGRLDRTLGGPDIDYPLGLTVPRRTIYFRHAAEKEMVWMQVFDGPSVTECYERKPSIVPQQALALINSEMTLQSARVLAGKLSAMTRDPVAFTTAAFEHVLSRAPTSAELAECTSFLAQQSATAAPDSAQHARENLIHVLLNHHEFVTIR